MIRPALAPLPLVLLLGCSGETATPQPQPTPTASTRAAEPVSILRPDVEQPAPAPPEPARLVLTFEDGSELSEAALGELETLLATEVMDLGGPITISGHSDAVGSDAANRRISQARADAVAEWLAEQGVAAERITTVALGEQNPIAPNALPDGSPNEPGRKTNRRVEITVEPPGSAPSAPATPEVTQ